MGNLFSKSDRVTEMTSEKKSQAPRRSWRKRLLCIDNRIAVMQVKHCARNESNNAIVDDASSTQVEVVFCLF